jgi:hypothetical protein
MIDGLASTVPCGSGSTSRRLRALGRCARALPEVPVPRLVRTDRSLPLGACRRTDSDSQGAPPGRRGLGCERRSFDRPCGRLQALTSRLQAVAFPGGGSALLPQAQRGPKLQTFRRRHVDLARRDRILRRARYGRQRSLMEDDYSLTAAPNDPSAEAPRSRRHIEPRGLAVDIFQAAMIPVFLRRAEGARPRAPRRDSAEVSP